MELLRRDRSSLLCLLVLGSFATAATLAQCEASNSMYSSNSPNSLAFKLLRTLVIESTNKAYSSSDPFIGSPNCITPLPPSTPISIEPPPLTPFIPPTTPSTPIFIEPPPLNIEPPPFTPFVPPTTPSTPIFIEPPPFTPFVPPTTPSTPISIEPPPLTPVVPPSTAPSTPTIYIEPPPPSPSYYLPPLLPPYPPIYEPSPPSYIPSPPEYIPSPIGYLPAPPTFLPPVVYPPPSVPPPPYNSAPSRLWCVAKPTVPDPILQEAMDFACGFGANCIPILPSGMCYQPDTVIAHASYAFNNYWQRRRVAGGTCDFDGTGMLVTVDPSYDGCNYNLN